jgi:hypothetical protein
MLPGVFLLLDKQKDGLGLLMVAGETLSPADPSRDDQANMGIIIRVFECEVNNVFVDDKRSKSLSA